MKNVLLFTSILVVHLYNQAHAQRITKHVVYFEVDSYIISPSEKALLENFIKSEASNDFISKVRIQGHTDSDASNDYNHKLSAKRVKNVLQLFEGTGLESKIESYWMGEDEPVNNNLTDAEKRLNRRVEITIEHWVPDLVEESGSIKDL
ncbi:MAG: OmpA family protein, partial [Crocinitomicaceae bacterium]|nr:OmpA family protein [Crocinitomicaceae bacterium]